MESESPPMLDYEILRRQLTEAPMTWLPAILATVVNCCDLKGVFQEGGLERFVAKARVAQKEARCQIQHTPNNKDD